MLSLPRMFGMSLCLLVLTGCASSKSSNTARTATEQLLIANAVDQSLNKVDFRPFHGHNVYLNDKYVDCVDKSYVISSVRHRVLAAGAMLVDDPKQADVLMELRCGTVGTDTADSFIGIPEVTLPGVLTLPEIRLLTRSKQTGTAKLGLVAVDARTNQVLGAGGTSLAQSDTQNWFVMGVGPFRSGSVSSEVKTSTTGPSGQIKNWLPTSVAFRSPPADPLDPDARQYVETEKAPATEGDAQPAKFEEPAARVTIDQLGPVPPRMLPDDTID